MKKLKRKKSWLAVLAAAIIFVSFFVWLVFAPLGTFKANIFEVLHLPLAFVEGKAVSFGDYQLAKKVISASSQKQGALDTAILNLKYEILVDDLGWNRDQWNSEKIIEGFSDSESKKILQVNSAREYVVFWYNSQKNLNLESYAKAESLAKRARNGESMDVLARNYSEEDFSRYFSGEVGQIKTSDLLPEIAEGIFGMEVGEIKVLPSRYGLHVVKMEKMNKDSYELKQVFVSSVGFEKWESAALAELKSRKIFRID